MFFGRLNRWKTDAKRLRGSKITPSEFVNSSKNKTLYYSTPFLESEKGQYPNALKAIGSDTMHFPAFSGISALKAHMASIGCADYFIIKGDLNALLASLDSHHLTRTWGVVVDPNTPLLVCLPPETRVRP